MQLLVVDAGTGTQDILLFDSERTPENCLRLVMPSPTLRLSRQVAEATRRGLPLVITGRIMGGGPVAWAVEAHRKAGLPVLAEADPARTFDDDLDAVRAKLGVAIVAPEEARRLAARDGYASVTFGDFDYAAIRAAFGAFGVDLAPDGLALAAFDHGAAPPGISDRQFRMDYLADRLGAGQPLSALAHRAGEIPPSMTRLAALADAAAETGLMTVVMDTAPAAVLGALEDPQVAAQPHPIVVNVGNFHTLAFQFDRGRFLRLFEHHTGELAPGELDRWLGELAAGTIRHEAVFAGKGHGALALEDAPLPADFVAVVGPRRGLMAGSPLPVIYAVPYGDQMLAGCYGLLRACAGVEPAWREPIVDALDGRAGRSLW
jgi:uncharacterized protein (DUF1786 family)